MSEENKAVVRRYFDSWGAPEAERESLAPDFVAHMPGVPEPMNREAFMQYQGVVLSAFPDFAPTLEDQVAEEIRWPIAWYSMEHTKVTFRAFPQPASGSPSQRSPLSESWVVRLWNTGSNTMRWA